MGHARGWQVVLGVMVLLRAMCVSAADFTLTADEANRVTHREIVVRASLDANERRGTVRSALIIDAPPAAVFAHLTRCKDALRYAPHLRACHERDRAADGSWALVEHEVDFGWYAPTIHYVFRADFIRNRSIRFQQVSGDFRANKGLWELEPADDNAHTLLRYRVFIDPPRYTPNWIARSMLKHELPKMLADLRKLCEAEPSAATQAHASPH